MYDTGQIFRVRWSRRRRLSPAPALLVLLAISTAPWGAHATCTDTVAKAAVRAQIEMTCPCAAATERGEYLRCAKGVIAAAVTNLSLPPTCRSDVTKCVSRSTCGRGPGWVTCCATGATGRTKCKVKSSAAKCRAPSGGASCTSGFPSCCDACGVSGCATAPPTAAATETITSAPAQTPTNTPTPDVRLPTGTPTITATPTIPAVCQSGVGLPPIAMVPFTVVQASTQCGGLMLQNPAPAPPLSGAVTDAGGTTVGDLALGCLYAGNLAGLLLPDGATSKLDVVGVNLLPPSLTLSGSAGTGPSDCTRGAGPARKCANGNAGLDGTGTCHYDSDCGGQASSCALEPHCYFGPPIPVPYPVPSCVVSAFQADLCGRFDLLPPQATFATALSSRVYLSPDADSPCPRCVNGSCTAGDRVGQQCTAVGSAGTSLDCPPSSANFIAVLSVAIPQLTTGTSSLAAPDGLFCAGQVAPGAFGLSAARAVSETGMAPLGDLSNTFSMNLAGTFCIDRTGTLIDAVARLPGVGALTASGQIEIGNLLP